MTRLKALNDEASAASQQQQAGGGAGGSGGSSGGQHSEQFQMQYSQVWGGGGINYC